MKLQIVNLSGKAVGDIDLADDVWGVEVNEHLLWEAVKWQRARKRRGTHSTKTVAEVRGTNKKPYRQKGTGNARQGSLRSHQMVGGGRAFGPKPRDYDYTLPRKVKKGALKAALSLRAKEQKVIVLEAFTLEQGKTKLVAQALAGLGVGKVLVVDNKENQALTRGARNLPDAKFLAPEGINVYDVLRYETLVITADSVKQVEAALHGEPAGRAEGPDQATLERGAAERPGAPAPTRGRRTEKENG